MEETPKKTLVEWFLDRPYFIASVIFLVVVLGIVGFRSMPLNLFPDANYPVIAVIISWPGASASDVEDKVTRIVEKELSTIDLVRKVKSVSQDEMAAISVEFEYEKGLDAAATDVSNTLKKIESKLLSSIMPTEIFRVSDATNPVMTIALSPKPNSHLDLEKIRQLANNEIREYLLRIPEVADAEVFGGYFPEVTVCVNPKKLHAHHLSLENVILAIRRQNINIPDGLIIRTKKQYLIKTHGEKLNKAYLSGIVIGHDKNGDILLGDVADIKINFRERQSFYRGNGNPAIAINILRPEKGHVTTTIKAVEKYLPELKKIYPEINFQISDTQKDLIHTSITNMVEALRDAIIMTVGVIFLFLANIRLSLLAAVSIPFTYFLTFALMYVFGYELNIVTLTGVIVAVGLLLDDAIVVIENIDRHHIQYKKSVFRAVRDGLNEIILADWSGTYTTVIVLIPIMFIGGYVEKILRQFTVVLAISLLSSYIISITIIPLLASYILKPHHGKNRIEKVIGLFDRFIILPIKEFFTHLVHFAIRHKTPFILAGIFMFVISMKKVMPLAGRDLMPPMDTGIVKISFETESNTSLKETEKITKQIESVLYKVAKVKRISTAVGSESGVVSFGTGRIPQAGLITVHFVDRFHRKKSIWEIEKDIREHCKDIPGLKRLDVYDYGATPLSSIAAPIDIMISGPDVEVLNKIADKVVRRLMNVKGLTTVSRSWTMDKVEVLINVDEKKARLYGIDQTDISKELTFAIKGGIASVLRIPGEDGYDIRVRYPLWARNSLFDVKDIYIPSKIGPVPLSEIANVKRIYVPTKYTRQNLEPVVDVYGYRATTSIAHLQQRIEKALKGLALPKGYRIHHEGEVKNMTEAGKRLKKALIIAIILLYFSLVPTFRSWTNPLVIMITIPLAMIGAAWGLVLVGRHGCMPANMGMILLAGIVVNNSILLIDFIEKAKEKGADIKEAIEQAVKTRTRPILMTATGTIVGMLPIAAQRALGLERLSPLAVVAIGGLVVATFLTLIYIPMFYQIAEDIKTKIKVLFGKL